MSTPDLESALIKAAEEGDEDTVRTMIENGVVNLDAGEPQVRAWLHLLQPTMTRYVLG